MKHQTVLKGEREILALIEADNWMMGVLEAAAGLELPDWWVCAGFVRTKIWDTLHGFEERTPLGDIDVIYFDAGNINEETEKLWEKRLHQIMPGLPWSVKNQARMHVVNGNPPYQSSVDAISKFPETATALGVRLDEGGQLIVAAPCGLVDVLGMRVKPTPIFRSQSGLMSIYRKRQEQKRWTVKWPKVRIEQVERRG
ncbi:nucleotidyltransferase family protein [Planococcus sp. FY231025]|uniref:nucleotidyltransferase family protein n=1 Tax=Planococcus sp. FY231025 TaxID=3455699 RepID=UPI003F930A4B